VAILPDESPSSAPEADFGANDWLLEEMYEQYTADPSSVDETWVEYFKVHGAPTTDAGNGGAAEKPEPEPRRDAEPPTTGEEPAPTAAAPAPAPAQTSPTTQPPAEPAASRRTPTVEKPAPTKELQERAAASLLIPLALKTGQKSHSKGQSEPPCAGLWHVLPRTWTSL